MIDCYSIVRPGAAIFSSMLLLASWAGTCTAEPSAANGSGRLELKVSGDGHYFLRDGAPFFWLGDTAWSIVNRYTPEEADYYMEERRKQGFNVLNVMFIFDGGPGLKTAAADQAGVLPFVDMNPATPNEAYFKNIDRVVESARKKGFTLVVMPGGGSSGSFVNKKKIITKDNARAYGRWLGKRYKDADNIVWADGFDTPPWMYEEVARELATGLREGDGGSHLITYHPSGGSSSSYFHHEPWLAANEIQTWADYLKIYPMVFCDYLRRPAKPVIMAEGAYEEGPEYPTKPITPLLVRQQAYWSVLAGGFHTYGHNDMWRKNSTWRESLQSPGAKQMAILKSIFTARKWWRNQPDQSVFALGASGGKTLNAAMRSADGDSIIVYLSSPTTVSINMAKIASRKIRAKWVNPETGEESIAGEFPNQSVRPFTTPEGRPDAVLLLEAARRPGGAGR